MSLDLREEAERLRQLPLAALQTEYQRTVGVSNSTTRNRAYLVKRILFVRQHAHKRSPEEVERRRLEREIKREQEEALGVARGTHCILACDRCHVEVVVPVKVRKALKRDAERGGRSRFLCRECGDMDFRRVHEREGLERTRKQIEKERRGRPELSPRRQLRTGSEPKRPRIDDSRRSEVQSCRRGDN